MKVEEESGKECTETAQFYLALNKGPSIAIAFPHNCVSVVI